MATASVGSMRVVTVWAVLVALALLAAGCGGGGQRSAAATATPTATAPTCHRAALTPAQQRWLQRVQNDLARMRKAKTHARASRLTDRFLLDLGRGNLPNYRANRLIDHAAAAVTVICQDCFQALEAARPIAGPTRCT